MLGTFRKEEKNAKNANTARPPFLLGGFRPELVRRRQDCDGLGSKSEIPGGVEPRTPYLVKCRFRRDQALAVPSGVLPLLGLNGRQLLSRRRHLLPQAAVGRPSRLQGLGEEVRGDGKAVGDGGRDHYRKVSKAPSDFQNRQLGGGGAERVDSVISEDENIEK